ncbi:MAG: hypothetical protein HY360_09885 [Verrucomicrobia bacterium]|nr:hypothetical protein [Verrucomicrobiota bacterium]
MKTKLCSLLFAIVIPAATWGSWGTTNVMNNAGSDNTTPEQQTANAVAPTVNPTFNLVNSLSSMLSAPGPSSPFMRSGGQKGLQFKDPVVSPGFSYRRSDDGDPGGFGGNEVGGDLAVDADIYDGLITGLIYQHLYRGAENAVGTSEHLDSNGVSLYFAKRFNNLVNAGLAYNYAGTDHNLTRKVVANLDRDSNGFSAILGLSDKKGKWNWSTTTSFGYAADDYEQQKDLDTGRFTWSGGLAYDITKYFTLGATFNYHFFVFQDVFPGAKIRDDDYWTVGPQFQFFPTDNLTVTLDFNTEEGYAGVSAYNARLGLSIAF